MSRLTAAVARVDVKSMCLLLTSMTGRFSYNYDQQIITRSIENNQQKLNEWSKVSQNVSKNVYQLLCDKETIKVYPDLPKKLTLLT